MPSAPDNAAPAPFSIFISYASADRAQARLLGESLTSAGLDVWFDEEELAGGEAWDAKIRKQIRTCTYFMPVISATTEARREGYFRREWRLAVERTLDLADDVTFLVPVVIDDTSDYGARVPEKFTSVQWLRCPGGHPTPQLLTLARRLAAEPAAPATPIPAPTPARAPAESAPPLAQPPRLPPGRRARADKDDVAPRPFPVFPPFPAAGHRARFVYELIVWAGHLIAALWTRLPRWLRVIATVIIVFNLATNLFRFDRSEKEAEAKTAAVERIVTPAATPDSDEDRSEIANKILRATGAALDTFQGGRPLAVIAFGSTDKSTHSPARHALTALHAELAGGDRAAKIALAAAPLAANHSEADVFTRAAVLKCRWLVAGTARPAEGGQFTLAVKLYDVPAKTISWQTERTGQPADAATLGKALAAELLQHVTFEPDAVK